MGRWTGNPLAAGFTLPTLMWLRQNQPHLLEQADHVLLPKDYVRARWTGIGGTDPGDASATGMFDVSRRQWSEEILNAAGINPELLPHVRPSAEQAGTLLVTAAHRLGLPAGLPVAVGTGDQQAQAVGNGVIAPGLLSSTIGTGGQLFAPLSQYSRDLQLRLHTYCHAVPGQWHMQAATLTAGMALTWFAERVLDGRLTVEELAGAAMTVPAGAGGLFFLPHLAGERTPHMDPMARGSFHGLTLAHGWQEMSRAVMEGVVFSLRTGLDLMRAAGVRPERVHRVRRRHPASAVAAIAGGDLRSAGGAG